MTGYIVDAIWIILSYLLLQVNKRKSWKLTYILLTSCILFFRMAFRAVSVGSDLIRYQQRYYLYTRLNLDWFSGDVTEPIYVLLNKACTFFGIDHGFRMLLVISSFFLIGSVSFLIYKYSENVLISYMMYLAFEFYLIQFSALRQALAMSCICWAFYFCAKKKFLPFCGMVLIGYGLHRTAIIFLICYFIQYFKWNRKRVCLMVFAGLIYMYHSKEIGNLVISVTDNDFTVFESVGSYGTLSIVILLFIIAEFIFNSPIHNKDQTNVLLNNIMIMAFLFQILSAVSYNFTRLNLYFFQFAIIYFPNIINRLDVHGKKIVFTKQSKRVVVSIIVVVLFYMYISRLSRNPYEVLPYIYMWD